jgi:hypothetical protein
MVLFNISEDITFVSELMRQCKNFSLDPLPARLYPMTVVPDQVIAVKSVIFNLNCLDLVLLHVYLGVSQLFERLVAHWAAGRRANPVVDTFFVEDVET